MSIVLGTLFLLFASPAFPKIEAVLGRTPLRGNPNLAIAFPATQESEIVLSRDQYIISYNKGRRAPNWVAWKLDMTQLGRTKRTGRFHIDSELETYLSTNGNSHAVKPSDYKGTCLDRGHQIPSADRTATPEDNEATFLMSNMIPQTPFLNRITWGHLENYMRQLVKNGSRVYAIAGPIYDINLGAIGPSSDIQVPSKNFKIILVVGKKTFDIISVVIPNSNDDGTLPFVQNGSACDTVKPAKSQPIDDWEKYQVSISEIEKLSGIHFSIGH